MNYKLIDEDWIKEKIVFLGEEDKKLEYNWKGTDEEKQKGYLISGMRSALVFVLLQLKNN